MNKQYRNKLEDKVETSEWLLVLKESVGSQQMEFFNKYKDLFGVPQGLGVPHTRLNLNNQLFIQKNYIPTKTQEYSLNGKLRQLKKDYHEFEYQMDELSRMRQTPKRIPSRKGNTSLPKSANINSKSNENRQSKLPTASSPKRQSPKYDYETDRKKLEEERRKRQGWFREENNNILKHSELDHIFTNKLNKVYDLDDIREHTLPKPQIDLGFSLDSKRPNVPKQGQFTIKQRSKKNLETKGAPERGNQAQNAIKRRQKAKDNLQFRRKKLQQLLRTLW